MILHVDHSSGHKAPAEEVAPTDSAYFISELLFSALIKLPPTNEHYIGIHIYVTDSLVVVSSVMQGRS